MFLLVRHSVWFVLSKGFFRGNVNTVNADLVPCWVFMSGPVGQQIVFLKVFLQQQHSLSCPGERTSVHLGDLNLFLLSAQLLQIVLLYHRLKTLKTPVLDSKTGLSEGRLGDKYPFCQHFASPLRVWIFTFQWSKFMTGSNCLGSISVISSM